MTAKRQFVGLIILTIYVLLLPQSYTSANSEEKNKSKLNRIEQQEKEIEKQKEQLQQDKNEVETNLSENDAEQRKLVQEMNQIDQDLVMTKEKINKKESAITEANKRIEDLTEQLTELGQEIEATVERIEKREEKLKNRLRSIQVNGGQIKFIEVLFGAQSFMDLISRTTAVSTIMDQDRKLIEEQFQDKQKLEEDKETVSRSKNEKQKTKQTLLDQKNELVALKKQQDEQVAEKENLLAELKTEYEELEQHYVSIQEEEKAVSDQITSLKEAKKLAKQEEKRLKMLARRGGGNGTFMWPAKGRKTSGYGTRVHPITKNEKVHHGIDIATPIGTPLKAAGTGIVSVARSMGGYGKVIMLTHMLNGEQFTTVYAHLSSISVSPGQTVQQGEVIGKTGNTGNSTGPHLHFEIHKGNWNGSNSNSTNPMQYLP